MKITTIKAACFVAGVILILGGFKVTSSAIQTTWPLPRSADKQELTTIDRVLIVLRDNQAMDIQDEVLGTLWEESIKVCNDPEWCHNDRKNNPVNSTDRGIAMYNSYWRADISNECAYNLECAVTNMIKDFRAGKQRQWYGYRSYISKK